MMVFCDYAEAHTPQKNEKKKKRQKEEKKRQ